MTSSIQELTIVEHAMVKKPGDRFGDRWRTVASFAAVAREVRGVRTVR